MTIRQLARIAELSPAAVSLALRDSPKISAATVARVKKLAKQHRYAPDARIVGMMTHLRKPRTVRQVACLGVFSFYEHPRPWEQSSHVAKIYRGMQARAEQLGYRVEPFWLRAPHMSVRRFKGVLAARGIEGLLCLGSPNFDEDYPAELSQTAVVTVGLSIRTRLHRVINDAAKDTMGAMTQLHALGYRRIGLVLGSYEDLRSDHAHSSAYLGWCEYHLGLNHALPILRINQVDPPTLLEWVRLQRPDAIVVVHGFDQLQKVKGALVENRFRVPADIGLAAISPIVKGSTLAGMEESPSLMGRLAVEMLVSRIANRDLGIPTFNRIEMVYGGWVDGGSVRDQQVNS
jgi:LacI family transcriptional regulator